MVTFSIFAMAGLPVPSAPWQFLHFAVYTASPSFALAAEAIVVPPYMTTHAKKPNKRFINTILSPPTTDAGARSMPTAYYIASFALKGRESL
jgi:hypothetical protein